MAERSFAPKNALSENNNTDHRHYDKLFTESRRILWNDPEWRQGPERAHEVASQAIKVFQRFTPDFNKPYLEIGCGPYSPLGVSTVMYLNGVESAIAFDLKESDSKRSAEALYDLLAASALEPNRWNLQGQDSKIFFERLYSFNIQALKSGNLHAGISDTNLRYVIGNLESTPLADESVSLISSRATLEHISDFVRGMRELHRIMKPGGISFHSIDLVDHRIYKDLGRYNKWTFLTENNDCLDGLCNRLRINEILDIARNIGFTVDVIETDREEIPEDVQISLNENYKKMKLEDMEITNATCVFSKK